jgi:hypothetical protein
VSSLDFFSLGGYSGGMNERALAEALASGRARIISGNVRYDDYDYEYNGNRRSPGARGARVSIELEFLALYNSDLERAPTRYDPVSYEPVEWEPALNTPNPKDSLELLVKIVKVVVLAWANSLSDATKRACLLELK